MSSIAIMAFITLTVFIMLMKNMTEEVRKKYLPGPSRNPIEDEVNYYRRVSCFGLSLRSGNSRS